MGNNTSSEIPPIPKQVKQSKFLGLMDSIATKYILSQNFKDLTNLSNKDYCYKLVILTSDIFSDNFHQKELKYLDQRTKGGIKINQFDKDKILFLNKGEISKLDVQNSVKKRRLCIAISRFYIKIAHLYSALIMTLNPIYEYTDNTGSKQSIPFINKDRIPESLRSTTKLKKMNMCDNRIKSVLFENEKVRDPSGNMILTGDIVLSNSFCEMNKKNKVSGETKTLMDEPGMFELGRLYYDLFDYTKGIYSGMSDEAKREYEKDLKIFYKAFTGSSKLPDEIKTFSDIKLKSYHKHKTCKDPSNIINRKIKGKEQDKYFSLLGEKLKTSMGETNQFRDTFISILDEIFVTTIDNVTKNKNVTINPNLDMKKLDNLVKVARREIGKMYIQCENNFLEILNIYEAIIERQVLKNRELKLKNLKNQTNNVLANK